MGAWTGPEDVLDGVNANTKPILLLHFIQRNSDHFELELKVLADGCSGVMPTDSNVRGRQPADGSEHS